MINFFKKIFSYLLFGLKSSENYMFFQKDGNKTEDSCININQESRNVYKDIKKGEVTQEVEELRHSTYNVYRESNNYHYLGDGVAIKKETNETNGNLHFTLYNNLICDSLLDSFNKIESNGFGMDKYTLSIIYNDIPRFRLEKFCKMIEVDIIENVAKLKLHFSAFYDKYDSTSKSFLNELNKVGDIKNYYEIKKNEMCSNISKISFTTYKANGEDDLINYEFNNISYLGYEKNYFEHIITYSVGEFKRDDLLKKYYSKTMDDKYKNNEKKSSTLDLTNNIRNAKCEKCGGDMPIYDYDITKETFGYSICTKCLEKDLKS